MSDGRDTPSLGVLRSTWSLLPMLVITLVCMFLLASPSSLVASGSRYIARAYPAKEGANQTRKNSQPTGSWQKAAIDRLAVSQGQQGQLTLGQGLLQSLVQPSHPHLSKDSSSVWPADNADQTANSCRNGFLVAPRQVLWQYVNQTSLSLTEVVHAEDRLYIVFNIKWCQKEKKDFLCEAIFNGNWTLEFLEVPDLGLPSMAVEAFDLGRDGHGHTFVLAAPLPKAYQNHPRDRSLRVNIVLVYKGSVKRFDSVPFCLHNDNVQFRHLVACTEIIADAAVLVPEWVAYHSLQGFEHFYMYVNDDLHKVRGLLEPLVKAGIVTVIDWRFPEVFYGKHEFQQAQMNGCLLRMRGRARWVALTDVDEFIQALTPGMTVADYFNQQAVREHYAAVQVQFTTWGSNINDTVQAAFADTCKGLRLGEYRSRAKCCKGNSFQSQKMVANPRGMSYCSVHFLTTGGTAYNADPEKELRINHFKPQKRLDVQDDSLYVQIDNIRHTLDSWGVRSVYSEMERKYTSLFYATKQH